MSRGGAAKESLVALTAEEDPEALTQFVHRARDRQVRAMVLVDSLRKTTDVHRRFALLLTLGDYLPSDLEAAAGAQILARRKSSATHGEAAKPHARNRPMLR